MSRSRLPPAAACCLTVVGFACGDAPMVDSNGSSKPPVNVASVVPSPSAHASAPTHRSAAAPAPSASVTPKDMVEVPAGKFLMGCLPARDGECNHSYERRHEVELDAYVIDRTEVTVADYRACTEAGRCSTEGLDSQSALGGYTVDCNWKAGKDEHPINCIDWAGAAAYCAFAGKRLPTEAEWEKAARGSDGRIYPWGNERPGREGRDDERVVLLELRAPSIRDKPPRREYVNSTWPVGSRPAGKSPYGALDMLGNVWEWTADWFDRSAYEAPVRRNPQGPSSGTVRVVRGGHDALTMRVSERLQLAPAIRSGLVGFRCARSAHQP